MCDAITAAGAEGRGLQQRVQAFGQREQRVRGDVERCRPGFAGGGHQRAATESLWRGKRHAVQEGIQTAVEAGQERGGHGSDLCVIPNVALQQPEG